MPTVASAFLRSPNFSTHSRAMMGKVMGLAIMSGNQANGSLTVNFTVWRSRASTLSTAASM